MIDSIIQDIRFAARCIRQNVPFTAAAVIAIALGIGANTAIFSIVYTVLFRPLPYTDAGKLMMIWETRNDIDASRFPNPVVLQRWPASNVILERWQERNRSFERIAGFSSWPASLAGGGGAERAMGLTVTPEFLSLIDTRPAIGRTFLPEENREGKDDVVVLGHGLWVRRFGSDPHVLGKKLLIDGAPHTIIGVMAAGFEVVLPGVLARQPDFVLPLWHQTTLNRGFTMSMTIGKLKPGVTAAQAQAEMTALATALAEELPREHKGHGVRLVPVARELSGEARPAMLVLAGAAGCVLLICCANIANLLLARASVRQREIGVRAILGASRWRLARQMLTESMLLAAAGGAAGILLARWGVQVLVAAIPEGTIPRVEDIHVDLAVLMFAIGLSVFTGMLFGLVPAIEAGRRSARDGFSEVLKESGGRTGASGHARQLRNALVVSEIALALVLLTGAGLLARSFFRLKAVDLGFRTEHILTVPMMVTDAKYADSRQRGDFTERLLERVRGISGIEGAAVTNSVPMAEDVTQSVSGIELEGSPGMTVQAAYRTVTPDYFRVMGIRLRKGRFFGPADAQGGVALVNEAFVRSYVPGVRQYSAEPLGRRVKWRNLNAVIVGVIADVRPEGPRSDPQPELYVQHTETFGQGLALVVRSESEPTRLAPMLRGAIREINPDQALGRVATMEQILAGTEAQPRFYMLLLGAFAGLAVALASVGIYGVIAYSVAQRTHEIGVRMALGAERNRVLRIVIGQAFRLAVTGAVIGLVAAVAATRVLAKFLFGIRPFDAPTFAAVSLLLIAVTVAASWLPARRAMAVDPNVALRWE